MEAMERYQTLRTVLKMKKDEYEYARQKCEKARREYENAQAEWVAYTRELKAKIKP